MEIDLFKEKIPEEIKKLQEENETFQFELEIIRKKLKKLSKLAKE